MVGVGEPLRVLVVLVSRALIIPVRRAGRLPVRVIEPVRRQHAGCRGWRGRRGRRASRHRDARGGIVALPCARHRDARGGIVALPCARRRDVRGGILVLPCARSRLGGHAPPPVRNNELTILILSDLYRIFYRSRAMLATRRAGEKRQRKIRLNGGGQPVGGFLT